MFAGEMFDLISDYVVLHLQPVQGQGVCFRALCRIKLLPVTRFGGHMNVNC